MKTYHQNYFSSILTTCTKSKRTWFAVIVSAILCFSLILALFPASSQAAVVDGEGIERVVDTPQGEVVTKSLEMPKQKANKSATTAPNEFTPGFEQDSPSTLPQTSREPQEEETVNDNTPDLPNFDPNVENPVEKTNNTWKFLAVGALIVIIGLGIIFYISKSQGRD